MSKKLFWRWAKIYLLYVSLIKRANIKYDLKPFYNRLFLYLTQIFKTLQSSIH